MKMSGEQAVARTIESCGVDHFFYVEGGMATLFSAIEKTEVRTILCRNEKAAGMMADGYARVTRRPTMCYGQQGAASAILASMLYEPMFAHSPVVALTGAIPTVEKDQWRYQEVYEMPYFISTCKFSVDVTDVSRLPDYIRTAVQISASGCPGPTHVGMHNDMAREIAEVPEIYGDLTYSQVPPFRTRAGQDEVLAAAKLLLSSERPVIVSGTGVHISQAYDQLLELAELLAIPVATDYGGKGAFPEDHELSIGVAGTYGREVTNQIIRQSDLVFFVATRAGRHTTSEGTAPAIGKTKIIHLDIDPVAIGRIYKTEVALVGDARATLSDLVSVLRSLARKSVSSSLIHNEEFRKMIRSYDSTLSSMENSEAIPIKPQRLMKEISKVLKPDDIVVSDTGQMVCWTTRFLKFSRSSLNYIPCGGTLGSSFPLALGVSFASKKNQRVVNLMGDGGIAYNLAELETALRYNEQHGPIVLVVNNNSSLAQGRSQAHEWEKRNERLGAFDLTDQDYAKVAEAFGCFGIRVERPGEIGEAIENAFKSGKPGLVDVITDKLEYAPIGTSRISSKEAFPGIPTY